MTTDDLTVPLRPVLPVPRRAIAALGSALAGPLLAGAILGFVRAKGDRLGGAIREAALFAPIAIVLALILVPIAAILTRDRVRSVSARLHKTDASTRSIATGLIVLPVALIVWIALSARAGQFFLTAFHHVGLAALAQAVGLTVLLVVVWFAVFLARALIGLLFRDGIRTRAIFVPAAIIGSILALAVIVVGIRTGDVQGHGRWFGALGVLKKPELDLSSVYALTGSVVLAVALTVLTSRRWLPAVIVLLVSVGLSALLLRHAANHFGDAPSAAMIEARPGFSRFVLRFLRNRTDRDHDGSSGLFGGGDCNDHDPRINPNAHDIPGNHIDEDCSGRDAPPPALPPPPPPSVSERLLRETPADMNLIFITVDTMRWDLHYAGNPHELSPNMDRLATQSAVFDQGYAISSYTGRAVGPLLIGRYPTECIRDGEHFTSYPSANVFLAERLHDAGFHTMGAASHFYFQRQFGLPQGIDRWDLSATPSMEQQELASADSHVADRALEELQSPENNQGRFFMWIHFFDPHKQYVAHPDLPSFGTSERARYEGEIESSDREIGRLITALDALPIASRTIVVVTADHGEAFGEHDVYYHGVELWNELIRIPWIMRVPGVAARHIAIARSQIDLAPTLLELLRLPVPARDAPNGFSGVSLVPDLLGEPLPARPIYVELPEGPFNSMRRSVIDQGWKLTERGSHDDALWNLNTDPGELTDLAHTRPADLSRMQTVMEQVRSSLHSIPAIGERHGGGSGS